MYHAATEEHHCACLADRMDDRFRRKFGNYAGVDAHEHPFFTVHRVDFVTMGATQKRAWTLLHFTVIQVDAYRSWARSEARRVGKKCVRTCQSRWSAFH